MTEERVVLVDENDREIGTGEKLAVHRSGALHRAFSVFIFDPQGRVFLQRRAGGKYHSAGRWSNTCCGHPRPGEAVEAAARRRLREEMGFDCPLTAAFTFRYRAALDGGLTEHEVDHVFVGAFEGVPSPDRAEVAEWQAITLAELASDLGTNPGKFSAWLRPALDGLLERRSLIPGEAS
jgi:isopentenyl-diphosphate delta-isomerase